MSSDKVFPAMKRAGVCDARWMKDDLITSFYYVVSPKISYTSKLQHENGQRAYDLGHEGVFHRDPWVREVL